MNKTNLLNRLALPFSACEMLAARRPRRLVRLLAPMLLGAMSVVSAQAAPTCDQKMLLEYDAIDGIDGGAPIVEMSTSRTFEQILCDTGIELTLEDDDGAVSVSPPFTGSCLMPGSLDGILKDLKSHKSEATGWYSHGLALPWSAYFRNAVGEMVCGDGYYGTIWLLGAGDEQNTREDFVLFHNNMSNNDTRMEYGVHELGHVLNLHHCEYDEDAATPGEFGNNSKRHIRAALHPGDPETDKYKHVAPGSNNLPWCEVGTYTNHYNVHGHGTCCEVTVRGTLRAAIDAHDPALPSPSWQGLTSASTDTYAMTPPLPSPLFPGNASSAPHGLFPTSHPAPSLKISSTAFFAHNPPSRSPLILEAEKTTYCPGEPVTIRVTLKDATANRNAKEQALDPALGRVILYATDSEGQFRVLGTPRHLESKFPAPSISRSEKLTREGVGIWFGTGVSQLDSFELGASYTGLGRSAPDLLTDATPISITRAPRGENQCAEEARTLFSHPEARRFMWLLGGDHLQHGMKNLEQISQAYPSSVYAPYANLALGVNLAYPYLYLDGDHLDTRPPDFARAEHFLDLASAQSQRQHLPMSYQKLLVQTRKLVDAALHSPTP